MVPDWMQDIKELNADLENTDPAHLKVSPRRKEPVPATQSSPTRLPLIQILGNLNNASARLLPVLQNKAHGEDDQQSKLDATSCEVGPNARRWAAQHRYVIFFFVCGEMKSIPALAAIICSNKGTLAD